MRVQLPGASPEEVTSQVVLPLEEAIAAVSGIEEMRAMVTEGSANIIVTFVLERDIGEAAEDVREKVQQAMRKLPPNVLPPTVTKADPDSDPVITLAGQRQPLGPRTDRNRRQDRSGAPSRPSTASAASTSAADATARSTSFSISTS